MSFVLFLFLANLMIWYPLLLFCVSIFSTFLWKCSDCAPPIYIMFSHLSAVTDILLKESREIVRISGIMSCSMPNIYPVLAMCPIKA